MITDGRTASALFAARSIWLVSNRFGKTTGRSANLR